MNHTKNSHATQSSTRGNRTRSSVQSDNLIRGLRPSERARWHTRAAAATALAGWQLWKDILHAPPGSKKRFSAFARRVLTADQAPRLQSDEDPARQFIARSPRSLTACPNEHRGQRMPADQTARNNLNARAFVSASSRRQDLPAPFWWLLDGRRCWRRRRRRHVLR